MKKIKGLVTTLVITALLVGSIGLLQVNASEGDDVTTVEIGIMNDPDPVNH